MKKEKLTVYTNSSGTISHYNADGELHNPNGPAVIYPDGDKWYYINGKRHNPNGPAVVYADGSKAYYINGERHNPNGPAVIWASGVKWYYINGEELSEAEFKTWQTQQSAPLHNKTATIDGVEYTLTEK
jgi:hypothetical protein